MLTQYLVPINFYYCQPHERIIHLWSTAEALYDIKKNIDDSVMAAHGVSFESSGNIEERKVNKRQARQEALEKV